MGMEKPSKNSGDGMNASPKALLADLCGPREIHDSRESWLRRGARQAGLSYRQAKGIFYAEITDPENRAVRLIREKLERERRIRAGAKHEKITHDNAAILARALRLQSELERVSAELAAIRTHLGLGGDASLRMSKQGEGERNSGADRVDGVGGEVSQ
jgi:hypothetical protein